MEVCHKAFPLAPHQENPLLEEPGRHSEYLSEYELKLIHFMDKSVFFLLIVDNLKNEKRGEPWGCGICLGEVHNRSVNIVVANHLIFRL